MGLNRMHIMVLAASLTAIVGIANYEGFSATPYIPMKGDMPTNAYGHTDGVTMNTPPVSKAEGLQLLRRDVTKFEGAIKSCVKVPLYQYEYDAYTQLTYNIGGRAFCHSTLVRRLNARDYAAACQQILRWDRFRGQPLRGLTHRRKLEYHTCIGAKQ